MNYLPPKRVTPSQFSEDIEETRKNSPKYTALNLSELIISSQITGYDYPTGNWKRLMQKMPPYLAHTPTGSLKIIE